MVDIQLLRKIVKEKLENLEGSSHSFDHTERVYEKANIIAKQEGGDILTIQVASLLHDIGRSIGEPHNETDMHARMKTYFLNHVCISNFITKFLDLKLVVMLCENRY